MSKLTLDEAIQHCLEVAEQKEHDSITTTGDHELDIAMKEGCIQCAADHRQLAEWLTELKELRNSVGAVKLKDMKDAVGLLQELDAENNQLTSQLVEAKRLLKLAVEDMNSNNICFDINACNVCTEKNCISCDTFHWRYTDEALRLIGDEPNGI